MAVEKGSKVAQFNLGLGFYFGIFRNGKKMDEAIKLFTLSAKQGYADAQYRLGIIYANGRGVSQNYIQAYMWACVAKVNGNEVSKEMIKKLDAIMSQENIQKAQKLAKRCIESNYEDCGWDEDSQD